MTDHGKEKVFNFPFDWKESLYFFKFFFILYSMCKKKKSEIVCPAIAAKLIVAGQDKYMNNTNDLISKDKESLTLK